MFLICIYLGFKQLVSITGTMNIIEDKDISKKVFIIFWHL